MHPHSLFISRIKRCGNESDITTDIITATITDIIIIQQYYYMNDIFRQYLGVYWIG